MPLGKYTISHKNAFTILGIFFHSFPLFFYEQLGFALLKPFFFLSTLKEVEVENQVIFRTTKQIVSSS